MVGDIFMQQPKFQIGDLVAAWLPYEHNGIITRVDEYIDLQNAEERIICFHVYWPNGQNGWYMHEELVLIRAIHSLVP
jgi:hypothetical protein